MQAIATYLDYADIIHIQTLCWPFKQTNIMHRKPTVWAPFQHANYLLLYIRSFDPPVVRSIGRAGTEFFFTILYYYHSNEAENKKSTN